MILAAWLAVSDVSSRRFVDVYFAKTDPTEALTTIVSSAMIALFRFTTVMCSESTTSHHVTSFMLHDRRLTRFIRTLLGEFRNRCIRREVWISRLFRIELLTSETSVPSNGMSKAHHLTAGMARVIPRHEHVMQQTEMEWSYPSRS